MIRREDTLLFLLRQGATGNERIKQFFEVYGDVILSDDFGIEDEELYSILEYAIRWLRSSRKLPQLSNFSHKSNWYHRILSVNTSETVDELLDYWTAEAKRVSFISCVKKGIEMVKSDRGVDVEKLEEIVDELNEKIKSDTSSEIEDLNDTSIQDVEQSFWKTGTVLDEHIQGVMKGSFNIIMGMTGIGKTWFGINFAKMLLEANQNVKVMHIETELEKNVFIHRLIRVFTDYDKKDVIGKNLSDVIEHISTGRYIVKKVSTFTKQLIEHLVSKHNPDIIIIDQLNHYTDDLRKSIFTATDRWRQLADFGHYLLRYSLSTGKTFVGLMQTNRGGGDVADLSAIAESFNITWHARLILQISDDEDGNFIYVAKCSEAISKRRIFRFRFDNRMRVRFFRIGGEDEDE